MFQLNGKIYSRWYYDWESGANKAQRLMKHVLKAYVFEKCAVDSKGNLVTSLASSKNPVTQSYLYRVAAVIVSPEFTVISYRRAPTETLALKGDAQQISYYGTPQQLPSPTGSERHKRALAGDVTIKEDLSYQWGDDQSSHGHSHHNPFEDADPRTMKRRRPTDSFVRPVMSSSTGSTTTTTTTTTPSLVRGHGVFEDKVMWEHVNASAVTTSKNLALLLSFAQWTPLSSYAPFVDELVHITHRRLLEPLAPGNHQVGKINCFSRVLLEQAEWASAPKAATKAVLPYELEALLRVMAQAALWFFSEETRQGFRVFFAQHASNILDKHALRASFLAFVRETEERLNHHVFAMTPLKSLANVAEEIIAAVYSYETFHSKRPHVRHILGSHGFAGWNAFVAQIRDSYIASSLSRKQQKRGNGFGAANPHPQVVASTFLQTCVARNAFEHGWNGEWLLDTEEAVWKQQDPAGESAISLFTIFDLISQIGRLEIGLGVQERTLRVRSAHSMTPGTDAMSLVLDGRERIFRLFPNGMSSSVSDGSTGDYIGSIHMEGKERLVVYLELFRWAVNLNDRSHHVRMRIECWRNHRLYVNGEVLQTVSASSFAEEERPYLSEMKLRAKRKSVSKAHARQFHAAVPPEPSTAAFPPAWKALGRFRLSYHRLG